MIAPASENQPSGGQPSGAGASLWLAAVLAFACACDDEARPRAAPVTTSVPDRAAADPAHGITTELDGAAPAFGDGVLAELTGDTAAARDAFERVLGSPDSPAPLAARAALHLAQMHARAGKSRDALDFVARATALAPADDRLTEGVQQLHADIVAAAGAGDIRGPRIGTALPGVSREAAEGFAAAERSLAAVHKIRPRPLIEALSTSIRVKERTTEDLVARYRAVAEHGGLAAIASHYRAGSLYHDLAIGLLFELPPELDPAVAAGLRRTLRGRALSSFKKAVAEYRACLAAPASPDAELWRLAAETDLRRAQDIIGEAAN